MSIRWTEREKIDADKWDSCLAAHPQTDTLFAQLWYLDACCEHWDALVEDDYRAVWPLCHGRKFGISYIYPPYFVAQIGILGNPHATAGEWLSAIPKKFLKTEVIFNACNSLTENLQQHAFTHHTYLLSCHPSYEELYNGYHQNHRRNLKKAESCGLQISHEADPEKVIQMFRQHRGKQKNVGFRTDDYRRLNRLLTLLDDRQVLETWAVLNAQGECCAAAFFTRWKGRYTFLFSGRTSDSNRNRAMFFLINRFIQAHAGEDILLDFNGSNNGAIAKFYSGFGAEEIRFFQVNTSCFRRNR